MSNPTMTPIKPLSECPHVALIGGRLYGYGETHYKAYHDFIAQISGGTSGMRSSMHDRVKLVAITDEEASEVAEMLGAEALSWA